MEKIALSIGEASYPEPFSIGLEYNPPVHVTWNIVHIGMQVPDSMQVYICATNCMRGVIMTAYEMGAEDRFACVTLEESDILRGDMEKQIIDGVSESIRRYDKPLKAVIVFPVCIHKVLSTDLNYVYKTLRARFPNLIFMEAYMDPLSQKEGLPPDQRLRAVMYDGVQPLKCDGGVNLLGSEVVHDRYSDLCDLIKNRPLRQLQGMRYSDYLQLGASTLNICTYSGGDYGIQALSKRLNQDYLYLSSSFDYEEIDQQRTLLCERLGISAPEGEKEACEEALAALKGLLQDIEIVIDYVGITRPLSLARLLLDHGFHVTQVYLDTIFTEEKKDFDYLQAHYPHLTLLPTIHSHMRVYQNKDPDVLAIGPKAAYFRKTPHFVNMIENGGLWGYKGILGLCELMKEAYLEEKDPAVIVPRKGLGCECVL